MSEAVSFLNGAEATHNGVTVRDAGPVGMVTLRGDLSAAKLKTAVKKITGQPVPGVRKSTVTGGKGACWMSPDELLIVVPHAEAAAAVAELESALAGSHFMAVNLSDARACMTLSGGAAAREVLAKIAPVDLSASAFGAGDFRRTRMAQVAGAFWLDDAETFHVVCFRSVGHYVFGLLENGAKAGPVGVLA
ncbi:sarcosine oxidase subunit gamma [Marivivens marinus]|uniref:sarcosine oxidase subunit gamma n=1 Tax=Marivivens marinus TaxID=3110173 RepID=UPI003B848DD9